jgi:hypothetical protein
MSDFTRAFLAAVAADAAFVAVLLVYMVLTDRPNRRKTKRKEQP